LRRSASSNRIFSALALGDVDGDAADPGIFAARPGIGNLLTSEW
jgi:hypothetical protein